MKKNKFQKKLILNKNTIVNFDNHSMSKIAGGFLSILGTSCNQFGCSAEPYPCDTDATCNNTYCETCTTICTFLSGCEC